MKKTWIFAAVAALGLVGCGGGGGGDSSTPVTGPVVGPAALTASNFEVAAISAASATFSFVGLSDLATGAVVTDARSPIAHSVDVARRYASRPVPSTRLVVGAVFDATEPCAGGGSITASFNDANNNGRLDVGDSLSIRASNCIESGQTSNGRIDMRITASTGNLESDVYSATIALTILDFGTRSSGVVSTANGRMDLTLTSTSATAGSATILLREVTETVTALGQSFTATYPTYQVDVVDAVVAGVPRTTISANGGFSNSLVGSGLLNVTTSSTTPFVIVGNALYPSSGRLQITGSAGGTVRITAETATTALVELDADGNGSFERSVSRNWVDLY